MQQWEAQKQKYFICKHFSSNVITPASIVLYRVCHAYFTALLKNLFLLKFHLKFFLFSPQTSETENILTVFLLKGQISSLYSYKKTCIYLLPEKFSVLGLSRHTVARQSSLLSCHVHTSECLYCHQIEVLRGISASYWQLLAPPRKTNRFSWSISSQ